MRVHNAWVIAGVVGGGVTQMGSRAPSCTVQMDVGFTKVMPTNTCPKGLFFFQYK